jgi:hypothetical protein
MRSAVIPKTAPAETYTCVCGGRLVLHAVDLPPATFDLLASLDRCGVLAGGR